MGSEDLLVGRWYPTIPVRDMVALPGMIVPLFVGRQRSIRAVEQALSDDREMVLVTQRDASQEEPTRESCYDVGCLVKLLQILKMPDDSVKLLVEVQERVRIELYDDEHSYYRCFTEPFVETPLRMDKDGLLALRRMVLDLFESYAKAAKQVQPDAYQLISQVDDLRRFGDITMSHVSVSVDKRQKFLELASVEDRLLLLGQYLEEEIRILGLEKEIQQRVESRLKKNQEEYYLSEQIKVIQQKLAGEKGEINDLDVLEKSIREAKMPPDVEAKALSECKKLRQMSPMGSEAGVTRNYLDWLVAMPWHESAKVRYDLDEAKRILDHDHYGIDKVKERILEHLAVEKRTQQAKTTRTKATILCLVGPPGVGKTSLARSIAEATSRPYVRFALGGVRDEAEVRGHRRTYVGAMPGKIIQLIKQSKVRNPLFLLDEIEKIGSDYRGDPSAALLEVLDPEQNRCFMDHYLEVEYDLSSVMFVATANSLSMPRPLLDRLEIIRLSGYTEEEKLAIAEQHLIPKLTREHGLSEGEWSVSRDSVVQLIRYYTREAGVRSLERELSNLARKAVKEILTREQKMAEASVPSETSATESKGSRRKKKAVPVIQAVEIGVGNLVDYAGIARYTDSVLEQEDLVGMTNGLAYTDSGGDTLTIEAVCLPGKGEIKTTGKLGEVMQESAQAAFTYIRSRALDYGIVPSEYQKKDIHIHVPEGATPKDGPSAGVAMCTSIVSALTGIAVRCSVAMTGEVTLRGRVLAIGGLKEKLLAALRGGIRTVFIPRDNLKDLADIPEDLKAKLEIVPVEHVHEVLMRALVSTPRPCNPEVMPVLPVLPAPDEKARDTSLHF